MHSGSRLALLAALNFSGALTAPLPPMTVQTIEPSSAWTLNASQQVVGAPTIASDVPYGSGSYDRPAATWIDPQSMWISNDGFVTGVLGGTNDREQLAYVEFRWLGETGPWTRVSNWYWDARTKLPCFPIAIQSRKAGSGVTAMDGNHKLEARCVPVNGVERVITLCVTLNTNGSIPRPTLYLDGANPNASDTTAIGVTNGVLTGGGSAATPFKTFTGAQVAIGNAFTIATAAVKAAVVGVRVYAAPGTYIETTKGKTMDSSIDYGSTYYNIPLTVEFLPDPAKPGLIYVKRLAKYLGSPNSEGGDFNLRLNKVRFHGITFETGKTIARLFGVRLETLMPNFGVPEITWFSSCAFNDPNGPFGDNDAPYVPNASQNLFAASLRATGANGLGPQYAVTESTASTFVFTCATFERNNHYVCSWDVHSGSGGNYWGAAKLNVTAEMPGDFWGGVDFPSPVVSGTSLAPNVKISADGTSALLLDQSNDGQGKYEVAPVVAGDVATVYWSPTTSDIGKQVSITAVSRVGSVVTYTISGQVVASAGSGILITVPGKLFPLTKIDVLCDGVAGAPPALPGQYLRTIVFSSTSQASKVVGKVSTNGNQLTFYDKNGNPAPTRATPGAARGDIIRLVASGDRFPLYSTSADAMTGVVNGYLSDDVTLADYAVDSYPLSIYYEKPGSARTVCYMVVCGDLTSLLASGDTFGSINVAHPDFGQFIGGTYENIVWYNVKGFAAQVQFFLTQTKGGLQSFSHTGLTIAADGVTCSLASWVRQSGEGDPGVGDLVSIGSVTAAITSVDSPTSFTVQSGKFGAQNSVAWKKTCTIMSTGTDGTTGLDFITFSSDAALDDSNVIYLPDFVSGGYNYLAGWQAQNFGDGGDAWRVIPGGYNAVTKTALVVPNATLRPSQADKQGRLLRPMTTYVKMTGIKDWWMCNVAFMLLKPPVGLSAHLEEGTLINLTIARSTFAGENFVINPVYAGKAANTAMSRWRFFDTVFMTDTYTPQGAQSSHGFGTPQAFAGIQRTTFPTSNTISYGSRDMTEDYLQLDNCHVQYIPALGGDNTVGACSIGSDFKLLSGVTRKLRLTKGAGTGLPPFMPDGRPLTADMPIGAV